MTHKFDVGSRNKLDNPKRREILPPDQVLAEIGLEEGGVMADIGCGIGYFSLPAARIVGPKGRVFALDIRAEMLADVEKNMLENNITNITTVLTEEYDLKLNDHTASLAFICLVLHEITDRLRFLREAKRIIKPGGKIVIIEWIKKESEWGPPVKHRLEQDQVITVLQDAGFEHISIKDLNAYLYIGTGVCI